MIAYHGLPLTPVLDMVRAMKGKAVMVSYANPEQMEVAAEMASEVVLDNGTFPAWMKGVDPDFDGYLEWATLWLRHPAVVWCLIPDKIDGTEEENDALLDAWPLPAALSVPVFHMHESLDRLRRLMERFPRIAIGSSGEFAEIGTPKWWRRMQEIMEVACDEQGFPLRKFHGLRMLDPQVTSHVPLSSGDSTNVARNVGIDKSWTGPYVPKSRWVRALVMMDRIEHHATARRLGALLGWCAAEYGAPGMNHACGHAKEGKFCKVCAAEQSRRNYERLQAGPPIWRELAIKPWRQSANSGES